MSPRRSAPWWLYPIAASFLGYFILLTYCELVRPEPLGLFAVFPRGRPEIADVASPSPASRAGLAAGDRVLRYHGYAVRSRLDWMVAEANIAVGDPVVIEVERGDTRVVAEMRPERASWRRLTTPEGLALRAARCVQLVSLAVAIYLAFKQPRRRAALVGASLLASVSVLSVVLPFGLASTWRQLPLPIQGLLWIPLVASVAPAAALLSFCAIFPRPLFRSRPIWLAIWIPMGAVLVWHVYFSFGMIHLPGRASLAADWSQAVVFVSGGYIALALALLVANYRRLMDVTERRRIRVLVFGWAVGGLSGGLVVGEVWLRSEPRLTESFLASPLTMTGTLLGLAVPLSFSYAILWHRLFDVSFLVRQGVRYALARRLLVALVPGLITVLALDLLLHGNSPLISTIGARGWLYATLGGGLALALVKRRDWIDALDRRFFRERYNAQQLLHTVAEDVRRAGHLDRVASRVVSEIEQALHPAFATLFTRQPGAPAFHMLATAPEGHAPEWLAADSKLVALLRLLGKPLEVPTSDTSWLAAQLPSDEARALHDEGIELIVPIAVDPSRPEAILVLGGKRSEEPYTADDQDLLAAIADSLALLLERSPSAADLASAETFQECPDCGGCFDTGTSRCPTEGAALALTPLPRLLAARYRIDRRLGVGGMGTVYAALDTALERRVAAKVIRHDLVGSAAAADRFRREARTAAAFTHPNVVTVHDYGVTRELRAFLVMELLEGVTAREEMARHGSLEAHRVLQVVRDVAAALEAAHRRGLVHRDLKPENIFLVRLETGDVAKVLDFGIAKALPAAGTQEASPATGAGILIGTLAYMPPEQLRGEDVSPAWDLWALGIVTYELVTGSHPFAAAIGSSWIGSEPSGHRTAIRSHLADHRARCERFFLRALALDPAMRPPSAMAFYAELSEALA